MTIRLALIAEADAARKAWKDSPASTKYQLYLVYVDASNALRAHDLGMPVPPKLALDPPHVAAMTEWKNAPEPRQERPDGACDREYPPAF